MVKTVGTFRGRKKRRMDVVEEKYQIKQKRERGKK